MNLPSPGLPDFDYVSVDTSDEVVDLLLKYPNDARLFMGGTDIFLHMRDRLVAPKLLVDVKHLPGMTSIDFDPKSGLHLGAATTLNMIARHPAVVKYYSLLAEAIDAFGMYQLRNRATIGGNLCNASPCADTGPIALVYEASLLAIGPKGERTIPAAEFFLGPGKNALDEAEFLVRIDFPTPPKGCAGRYLKLGRNSAGDLALVSVAVMAYPDESVKSSYGFRLALASVAPTPIRVPAAEAILARDPLTDETIELAANEAEATSRPIDDIRASAHYRKAMVKALIRRGILEVRTMLKKEG